MALFGSGSRQNDMDHEEYSPVEEEGKPLRGTDDEHDLPHREIYALSRSLRRTNLFLKVIIGLLCITIVSLLSINVPDTIQKVKSTKMFSGSLIPNPAGEIPLEKITFEKHPTYSQRPNDISDAAWDKLLPPGRGFVYLPDWEKWDLPPGEKTDYGMIYSVAVYHQMHCLGQLRRFSWMFLDAIHKNDTAAQREIDTMFVKMDHAEHMTHCFDYLRQTIQCGGDMTMEWPRTEANGQRFAVDGWGIQHECKSWGRISDYMAKNHFDHSTNTEIAPLVGSSGGI